MAFTAVNAITEKLSRERRSPTGHPSWDHGRLAWQRSGLEACAEDWTKLAWRTATWGAAPSAPWEFGAKGVAPHPSNLNFRDCPNSRSGRDARAPRRPSSCGDARFFTCAVDVFPLMQFGKGVRTPPFLRPLLFQGESLLPFFVKGCPRAPFSRLFVSPQRRTFSALRHNVKRGSILWMCVTCWHGVC